MTKPIQLASIPGDKYSDYRYDVIFKAYKWDPQIQDHNTISKQVVIMNKKTAEQLESCAEQLANETVLMEEALLNKLSLAKELGLPKKIIKAISKMPQYDRRRNVRLMRFDFHPTEDGWAVSEVNSDVPGGFAEASVLPEIAGKYFDSCESGVNTAACLLKAFKPKMDKNGVMAFVHATSYSDDRQVMQFLHDYFNECGFKSLLAAPDHIKWISGEAYSIIEGQEGKIDGITRFFPLDWLTNLKSDWKGYFNCKTPSCNHPIAVFAQSKRLPLVWDRLGVEIDTWKKLLPETKDPRFITAGDGDWIYKPAMGRVGEGISIKQAITEEEYAMITKAAHRNHKDWLAQRMFKSKPLTAENGEAFHLCIGVFTIDGKRAGFYGRISPYPRIDANAKDIPILILKEGNKHER